MRDMRQRTGDQRRLPCDDLRMFRLHEAHQGADLDHPVLVGDVVEAADAVDVDEKPRARQPHVQRGNESLAASEEARIALATEQLERMLDRACLCITKWRGLHAAPLAPQVGCFRLGAMIILSKSATPDFGRARRRKTNGGTCVSSHASLTD